MRIVYFAHSVLNRGGDKMVLAHLCHLAQAGHEVTIRSNVVATKFLLHHAFRLEKPMFPGKLGTLVSALLERPRGDLAVASIVPTAVMLGLRNPGRVLHFAQDDNETSCGFPGNLVMRWLYRLAFGALSIPCICVSRSLAEHFRARYGAECTLVENGVDTTAFFPAPSAELVQGKQGRRAILLLSRSDRRKGFDVAQDVVERLAKSLPGRVEVWMVGEPTAWQPHDVPCRHFGVVGEKQLREIMSSADVFLSPSRSEGFPLMVLEAFACGCPVVTTDAVGFVRDEEDALVAPVGDVPALVARLESLLADAGLAARLRSAGLRFAGEHSLAASSGMFAQSLSKFFPGV